MATRPGAALTRVADCAGAPGAPRRSRPASPVTCRHIAYAARSSLLQITGSGRIPGTRVGDTGLEPVTSALSRQDEPDNGGQLRLW